MHGPRLCEKPYRKHTLHIESTHKMYCTKPLPQGVSKGKKILPTSAPLITD